MAKQSIGLGSTANDGNGDDLRTAGDKINDNFTELYIPAQTGIQASRFSDGRWCQREHVLKTLREISAGTRKYFNAFFIGDSLGVKVGRLVVIRHLLEWFPQPENVVGMVDLATPQGSTAGGYFLGVATPEAVMFSKTQYGNIFTGTGAQVDSTNTTATFRYNGAFRSLADRLVVPILTEPSAGVVKIEIFDGSLRAPTDTEIVSSHSLTGGVLEIDADAAIGCEAVVIEFAATTDTLVEVTHLSGGAVKLGFPASQRRADACINSYQMTVGSNAFRSETTTGATATAKIIAGVQPDIFFIQSDDGPSDYENFLPKLKSAIDDASLGYTPLVVLVGEAPKSASQYLDGASQDLLAANRVMRDYAAQYGWYFFDGYNIAQTVEIKEELGYEGDGIHSAISMDIATAARIAEDLDVTVPVEVADVVAENRKLITGRGVLNYANEKLLPRLNNGLQFSGSNGHINVQADAAQPRNFTDFSWSFWGEVTSKSAGYPALIGNTRGVPTYFTGSLGLCLHDSNRLCLRNETGGSTEVISTGYIIANNEPFWCTITVETDTGVVKQYIDGVLVAEDTLGALTNTRTTDVNIMAGGDTARFITGFAKYVAMHSKILTPDEVTTLYESGGRKSVGDEVFEFLFDEGIGLQIRDRSANRNDGLASDTTLRWVNPSRSGMIRGTVNVSAGTAQLLSASQNVLPANAVITGYELREQAAAAAEGIQLDRNDRSTYNSIATAVNVGASSGLYVPATNSQLLAARNVRVNQASAGGTDVDVVVHYTVD